MSKKEHNKQWYKAAEARIGKRLFAVAVRWSRDGTPRLRDRMAEIKAVKGRRKRIDGSKSVAAAVTAVREVAADMTVARWGRYPFRRPRDYQVARLSAVLLHEGSMEWRLLQRTAGALTEVVERTCRTNTEGDISVRFGSVLVDQEYSKIFDYYSGVLTRYPKTKTDTYLHVGRDWLRAVHGRGISALGGMVTLRADLVRDVAGVQVYKASWLTQGRGYSLRVSRGVIAVSGDLSVHAGGAKEALLDLRKKKKALEAEKTSVDKLVEMYGDTPMRIDDARRVGACMEGIRNWMEATGIKEGASVREVYEAHKKRPRWEAEKAVIFACMGEKTATEGGKLEINK